MPGESTMGAMATPPASPEAKPETAFASSGDVYSSSPGLVPPKKEITPSPAANAQEAARSREAQTVLDLAGGIARRLELVRAAQARAAGLRLPAYSLAVVLAPAGDRGMTVSAAADRLAVRPQALAPVTAELEQDGLLSRLPDPGDRRARRLALTPAGRERLSRGDDLGARMVAELLDRVPSPIVARLVMTKLDAALAAALVGVE